MCEDRALLASFLLPSWAGQPGEAEGHIKCNIWVPTGLWQMGQLGAAAPGPDQHGLAASPAQPAAPQRGAGARLWHTRDPPTVSSRLWFQMPPLLPGGWWCWGLERQRARGPGLTLGWGCPHWGEGSTARPGPLERARGPGPREGTGQPAGPWAGSRWLSLCAAVPAAASPPSQGAGGSVPAPAGAAVVRGRGPPRLAGPGRAGPGAVSPASPEVSGPDPPPPPRTCPSSRS